MQPGGCLAYSDNVSMSVVLGSIHRGLEMPSQLAVEALQQSLPILHLAFSFALAVLHCTIHAYSQAQIFLLGLSSRDRTCLLIPQVVLGMLSAPSQQGTL